MYVHFFKRVFDLLLSLIAAVVLAIPMLAVAVIVKLDSPGPAFFKQRRIGRGGKEFNILKFRSMPVEVPHDVPTHQFNSLDMLTKWQRFIRKTSIDELPQIYNIIASQMSFIGPRPALWNQYDLIAERDKYGANAVKPGLTGWAQINGRDELEIAEKAKLDGEYANNLSFAFDCKCFFLTIGKVIRGDGVSEGGSNGSNGSGGSGDSDGSNGSEGSGE